jgi:radical SAM superfamily enzyme YgiQ (UPF0313 family)/MoaA/NifB/PqqE/SkfB family radical SAM enzyme
MALYDRIKKFSPDLIVLEISTPSLHNDLMIIKTIKDFSDANIVVAGMAYLDENLLKKNNEIDFALFGEYELTLLELVKKLGTNDFNEVKGLIYREEDRVIKNSERPLHKNLDELPWPYTEELPMKKYHDCPGGIPSPSAQIWASRGCPFTCTFCAWPQLMYNPHSYRTRSVKDFVDEIEFLKNKGFKSFYVDDDTFNVGKKRMLEICNEIRIRKINLPWAIMARVDLMDEEILRAMKESGLYALKYGVESSSQKLLDACDKRLDIKKAEENILLTQKLGIKVHLTFTFGLPGETKQTIQDTINFALRMNTESAQFSITTPFPGTKLYKELKESSNLVSTNLTDYDGNFKAVIKNENLTPEDIENAVREAYDVWIEHKKKRNEKKTAITIFKECLTEHGLAYTLKKTAFRIINVKKKRFRRKINSGITNICKINTSLAGPEYVTIDLTNKCNLNCIACWTFSPLLKDNKPNKEWFKQELSYEKTAKLINELASIGTKEVRITGGGEPFMHKDIFKIIELIKSKRMKCDITTNFTLLNKEKIKKLVDLQVNNLTISIWAGDRETYRKTHPNKTEKTFDKIKENLLFLKKIKTNTKIVLANVLSNINYEQVEEMVSFGEIIGADEVYFTFIDPIKGATDKLLLNEKERKELHKSLLKIKNRKTRIKIDTIENIIRRIANPKAIKGHYDSNMLPGMKCYVGILFARIMANGDIAPCCRAVNNITGNLNNQNFKEIWNGALQKEFRRNGLKMNKEFTDKIGCYKTCDNWWENEKYNKK